MKRPSIWVRDEFSANIYPPFCFILTLKGAVVECCFSRALQSGFHKMSTNDRLKYRFWFHQRSNRFRKQLLGDIRKKFSGFLPENQRYCCFWSFVIVTSCLTGEKKESLGNWYHPLCLKCKKCGRQLATGSHAEVDYCTFPCTIYQFRIFCVKPPQHSLNCTDHYNDQQLTFACLCYGSAMTRTWSNTKWQSFKRLLSP